MSAGEFSTPSPEHFERADTGPSSSLQNIEQISVSDLEGVLEMVAEELVLVERSTGNIMWMSELCRGVTHKLGATRNIDEFPRLRKLIDAAVPKIQTGTRLQARWNTIDTQWQQYIGDRRKCSVSVLVRPERGDHIWVRFYRSNDRDEYLRQSIAHHEELFSTSRSISVSEMVTTLAHELNQPLGTMVNIMNGLRTRLNDELNGNPDISEALELAQKQGKFASDVLQRLRDFAQSKKSVTEICDVNHLITETLELLDWVFVAEEVNVNFNSQNSKVELCGDSTLLQQVLVNLLRNSVDAMTSTQRDYKTIDITTSIDGDKVSITISDTGHGIDDNHEETMFSPFKSGKPHGMGVGLNICRSFIELHEGRFWFTQNDTQGCTANIVIPRRLSNAH